jgi:hypothetical protein
MKIKIITFILLIVLMTPAWLSAKDNSVDQDNIPRPKPFSIDAGFSVSIPTTAFWNNSTELTSQSLTVNFNFGTVEPYLFIAYRLDVNDSFSIGAETGLAAFISLNTKYTLFSPEIIFPIRALLQFGNGNTFLQIFWGMDYDLNQMYDYTYKPYYVGLKLAGSGFFIDFSYLLDSIGYYTLQESNQIRLKIGVGFIAVNL